MDERQQLAAALAERTVLELILCQRLISGSVRLTSRSADCKIAAEIRALGSDVGVRMSPSGHFCTCPDCSAITERKGPYITKGSRVRARWFLANDPPSSLAGMQLKFGVSQVSMTGTCVHFRGDDPLNPTDVRVYIDPDGTVPDGIKKTVPHGCTHEGGHVEIRSEWIVAVLEESK